MSSMLTTPTGGTNNQLGSIPVNLSGLAAGPSTIVGQNLKTQGYGGQGPTSTPNPYTQESQPEWMNGYYTMPSWGTDAVTGQPLTQENLQYQYPETDSRSFLQKLKDKIEEIRGKDSDESSSSAEPVSYGDWMNDVHFMPYKRGYGGDSYAQYQHYLEDLGNYNATGQASHELSSALGLWHPNTDTTGSSEDSGDSGDSGLGSKFKFSFNNS